MKKNFSRVCAAFLLSAVLLMPFGGLTMSDAANNASPFSIFFWAIEHY